MSKQFKMKGEKVTITEAVKRFILDANRPTLRVEGQGYQVRWVPKWKIEQFGQSIGCLAETANRKARHLAENDPSIICHHVKGVSHYAPCESDIKWYVRSTGKPLTWKTLLPGVHINNLFSKKDWMVLMLLDNGGFVASCDNGKTTNVFSL